MKTTVIVHLIAAALYGIGGLLLIVSGLDAVIELGIFENAKETVILALKLVGSGIVLAIVNAIVFFFRNF